jgi:cyclic pyranopterin phosphate synthase
MPEEGMEWLPRSDVLSFEEIERLARLLVDRYGIRSIRLTGGEPTVRARLPMLVARLAALGVDLSLTTNGATLALIAHDLVAAGLERVNVSLDSLQRQRFAELTGRDALPAVLEGIAAAIDAGLRPVKVNAVLTRGVNDDEIVDLAAFGRDQGVTMRFIEFMPLDADHAWTDGSVVPAAEIVARIDAVYPLEPAVAAGERGSEPADRWRYRDGRGEVGVIASVTQPFCSRCDRIRLTADGQLRTCLFATTETDLRGPMRRGASDAELAALLEGAVAAKGPGHDIGRVQFVRPRRSMSQIGG